jgi:hypothetical protein
VTSLASYLCRTRAAALGPLFLAFGIAQAQASPTVFRGQVQPAPQHLYVASLSENAVYAFPLKNGIPSRTPDAVLYPPLSLSGIAVDPSGYLYAADGNGNEIDAFAPGASGKASPIRQVLTDASGFGALAIFGTYIIADGNDGQPVIYGKPPDTPGIICPVCVTQPLEVMQTGHIINTLTTDPYGTIYASVEDGGLYEYPLALSGVANLPYPLKPARIVGIDTQYYGGLAVDTKDIYARDRGNGKGQFILVNVIPVGSSTGTPVRQMETKPCGPILGGETGAFAISGDYLYVECNTQLGVFVYDKRGKGLVSPVFSLTGPFQHADYIALGP